MADKLGLTNEIKEIKLGKSFMKGEHQSFHTFRYDFMPASVDTTKRAAVDIGEGHQVTVTVPHIEGSGTANTVFKGSKKPYQKECVLIIDHTTGEITLEKLSYNVQLKKTRAEGSSKIRSNTPIDSNFNIKKSPSAQQKSHSTFGRSSPVQKCSPLPKSPVSNQPSPNNSTNHSMPCLSLTSTKPCSIPEASLFVPKEEINEAHLLLPKEEITEASILLPKEEVIEAPIVLPKDEVIDAPEIGVLSSSSSSGSSSSEDSSDSSSSDNEEMTEAVSHKSRGFNLSCITNGFAESPNRKETLNTQPTNHNISSANSLPSMPKFSQLSEDLKLSESDSDSDD